MARSDTSAPAAGLMMVPVGQLAPHPDNPRGDLDLNPGFTGSIAESGVLVPLRITTRDDGDGYWIIDGARRHAGAVKAGVAEVPCHLADGRAGDLAGQYLDMVTTSKQRVQLKPAEEAAALFAAHQAGAPKTRMRKATGLTSQDVTDALTAGAMTAATRTQAAAAGRDLTLHELAILAEFDGDQAAVTRLTDAAQDGQLDHEAELLREERREQAELARLRAELETAGITITEELPTGAQLIYELSHDGAELTAESHADCPGRGAIFYPWAASIPNYYCADPSGHGHTSRWPQAPAASPAGAQGDPAGDSAQQMPDSPAPGTDRNARRLVIEGNRAWQAAAKVRHRWLTTLLSRKTAPPETARFVAEQLLRMDEPLRSGLSQARYSALLGEVTGHHADQLTAACGTVPAARLPLVMLAPLVVTFEHAMTDGELAKGTWRMDKYSPCPRTKAGEYLVFLASAGYRLSTIEQAVADGLPYTGTTGTESVSGQLIQAGETAGTDTPGAAAPPENSGDIDAQAHQAV